MIKQTASSIKDKAREAHVDAHLDGRYDTVNAYQLMYKLMSKVRTLRTSHNYPSHNRPPCNPHDGYIMWEDFIFVGIIKNSL